METMARLSSAYVRGVVKFFDAREGKNFGFIVREGLSDLFFHWGSGGNWRIHQEEVYSDSGIIPARPTRKPFQGDSVYYEEGINRRGKLVAVRWGLKEDFDTLMKAHGKRIVDEAKEKARLEQERLRCNPKFRAIEARIQANGLTERVRTQFEGTKQEFRTRYPLGVQRDPLISTPRRPGVDVSYDRWFEREDPKSTTGWTRCDDPRTTKLQMDRGIATSVLKCSVRHKTEEGVYWLLEGKKKVAECKFQGAVYCPNKLTFLKTEYYAETSFEGEIVLDLWILGASGDVEDDPEPFNKPDQPAARPIPDAKQYGQIRLEDDRSAQERASDHVLEEHRSRRGERKTAHDLAELGSAPGEWENIK